MVNRMTNESEAVVEVNNHLTLLYRGAGVHLHVVIYTPWLSNAIGSVSRNYLTS